MSMMSEIHAVMTATGEIARYDRIMEEVAELEHRAAASRSERARGRHLLRARLLRERADRMLARRASEVAPS